MQFRKKHPEEGAVKERTRYNGKGKVEKCNGGDVTAQSTGRVLNLVGGVVIVILGISQSWPRRSLSCSL